MQMIIYQYEYVLIQFDIFMQVMLVDNYAFKTYDQNSRN